MLGVVFFLQTNFDFLTSHFRRNFVYHSKGIVVLDLNLKQYFYSSVVYMACAGMLFIEKISNFRNFFFHFLITFKLLMIFM